MMTTIPQFPLETPGRSVRVFVVDDDALTLKVVFGFLSQTGYEVYTFQSAEHALSQMLKLMPDIVLLDIHMQGMDGFEACRHIKQNPFLSDIPVIFLTGHNTAAGVERGFACGAVDYLIKPVTQTELLARIRTHLALYQLGKQLRQQNERLRAEVVERIRVQEELQRSKERYLSIFNGVGDAILVENHHGDILEVNDSACRLYGYARETLLSRNVRDIADPKNIYVIAETAEDMARALPAAPVEGIVYHAVTGKPIQIELNFRIQRVGEDLLAMVVVRDISERKQMQANLAEAQKMAGIGTVAAGVAHELNSPLQVVIGQSESILHKLQETQAVETGQLCQAMEAIHRNGWRCASIVRSLLSYACPSAGRLERCDLNGLVRDALLLVEHQLKLDHILLVTELAEGLPDLLCDPDHIAKPLVNLLDNARDAMFAGGTVAVRTGYDVSTDRLWVQVEDTGPGIPVEIWTRIFDPFFTTKPAGKSLGLGLSQADSMVRAGGGEILVENVMPHGALLTLLYPKDGPQPQSAAASSDEGRYSD